MQSVIYVGKEMQEMTTEKKYLTAPEAAAYIRKSLSKLYKLTSKKKIEFYKPDDGDLLFTIEQLDNYVKKNAA